MTVKVDLATNHVDMMGDQFSENALQELAEQCVGMPIMVGFDHMRPPVGKILKAQVVNGRVEIDAQLKPSLEMEIMAYAKEDLPSITYVGPGFAVLESHKDGEVRVIDKLHLVETSMIRQHTDLHVRPVFQISTDENVDDPTGWPIPSQD